MSVDTITLHKWKMVTWHDTVFCKVKCHTELVNWGVVPGSSFSYSWLNPRPSSLGWVVQAGSEEPLGLLWALAKESHPCCMLYIIPVHCPRVSMIHPELLKPERQGQITTKHPWHTRLPFSFVFNCFHSCFFPVLHSWNAGCPSRRVEVESMSQAGGACWGCCRPPRH